MDTAFAGYCIGRSAALFAEAVDLETGTSKSLQPVAGKVGGATP